MIGLTAKARKVNGLREHMSSATDASDGHRVKRNEKKNFLHVMLKPYTFIIRKLVLKTFRYDKCRKPGCATNGDLTSRGTYANGTTYVKK